MIPNEQHQSACILKICVLSSPGPGPGVCVLPGLARLGLSDMILAMKRMHSALLILNQIDGNEAALDGEVTVGTSDSWLN